MSRPIFFNAGFEFSCFRAVDSCMEMINWSEDIFTWGFPAGGLFL